MLLRLDLSSLSIFSFQSTFCKDFSLLVGSNGFEPSTSRLSGARSNHLSYEPLWSQPGGDDGIRTHDPLLAGQVLSQLSYTPVASSAFQGSYRTLKIEQRLAFLLQDFSISPSYLLGFPTRISGLICSSYLKRAACCSP